MARLAELPHLVRRRTLVALNAYLAINLSAVWLDGYNLVTLCGFGQSQHLLLGQVAQVLESKLALKSVFMATVWASHRATTPISGRTNSIAADKGCQDVCSISQCGGDIL